MKHYITWLKLWCSHCKNKTAHRCLPDVQASGGLLWKCGRCHRSEVFTAAAASRGEQVG